MLRFTFLYAVLCGFSDIRKRIAMYPESIDTGVSRVAMVALHSQLYNVVGDWVLHAANVGCLRIFDWEVLDGCPVCIVHVIAE